MSHSYHPQSLSHQNQLLPGLSDCSDVEINYKSNCKSIIPLLRFRETGGRVYEDGLGLKWL